MIDRRLFLKSSGVAMAGLGFAPAFLRRALAAGTGSRGRVLVTIFQRGAVDGLSMVPPYAEGRYFELRPSLAIPRPGAADGALKLDDTFALHPALGALKPMYDAGALAVVQAVGSPDKSRSHFDAQDFLESGTPGVKTTRDGWQNRLLQASPGDRCAFRGVALQPTLPRSLAGPAPALALERLGSFRLKDAGAADRLAAGRDAELGGSAGEAAAAVRFLAEVKPDRFPPEHGAVYPGSPLGQRLKQIAQLIRADVGLEVAATDCGGWDTHAAQGAGKGQLAGRLQDFGDAIGAFAQDLGERLADVCLVTLTEFGRTVRENGSRGTDHGHGSAMLVLGGGVRGGRVVTRWKGLADAELFEGRDLPVTTDHRDVLGEALIAHLGVSDVASVFPGYQGEPRGVFAPAVSPSR